MADPLITREAIEHGANEAKRLWPEVLGGGLAYALHSLFHGLYHHVGRVFARLILRKGK